MCRSVSAAPEWGLGWIRNGHVKKNQYELNYLSLRSIFSFFFFFFFFFFCLFFYFFFFLFFSCLFFFLFFLFLLLLLLLLLYVPALVFKI
jgi:hypothetical protein